MKLIQFETLKEVVDKIYPTRKIKTPITTDVGTIIVEENRTLTDFEPKIIVYKENIILPISEIKLLVFFKDSYMINTYRVTEETWKRVKKEIEEC